MANIDNTQPADDQDTDKAEFRSYRTAVRGRINNLPDRLDPSGDQSVDYDKRHTSVGSGKGAIAGGDLNGRGDDIGGFGYNPVTVTSSTTIDLANWNDFQMRFVIANSSSPIVITIDDTRVDGTAQGATASTIVLDASDTGSDGDYNWTIIDIVAGTGSGQSNVIMNYSSISKTAELETPWATTPDSTSEYEIRPRGNLAMTIKRKGSGAVSFNAAGNLTREAVSNSISARYAWASMIADLNDQTLSISSA